MFDIESEHKFELNTSNPQVQALLQSVKKEIVWPAIKRSTTKMRKQLKKKMKERKLKQ